jgi:hypothetical protein
MENITYHASGFLSTAEYSARFDHYFSNVNKLASLEQVNVLLYEEPYGSNHDTHSTSIRFSDSGNICTINIPFSLYYQPNHKHYLPPDVKEVLFTIEQVIAAADEQHIDEF